jgi:hypothetical protein
MKTTINQEITVTALSFKGKGEFKSVPRRIQFGDKEVTFIDTGIQYLVQKGQHMVKLFDMTDGIQNYRLKFDPEQWTWTLLGIQDLARA